MTTEEEMAELGINVQWDLFKEDPARPYMRDAMASGYADGTGLARACKAFRAENEELPADGRNAYVAALAHSLAVSMAYVMGYHASRSILTEAMQLIDAMRAAGGKAGLVGLDVDAGVSTIEAIPDEGRTN